MKASPSKPSAKQNKKALSLLELLVVMAIVAIVGMLAVPAFSFWRASPKFAAERFFETLELAQKFSATHGVRTRVVFANDVLAANAQISNAYAVYQFYIPPSDDSARSSDFVGRWISLDASPEWRSIPDTIHYSFSNNATTNLEKLFFNPPQYWDSSNTNYLAGNSASSPFSTNYYQTPHPSSLKSPPNQFYNLVGIEFDLQGKPMFQDMNEFSVYFSDKNNSRNRWSVVVRQSSGTISLQSP
jgi:prepilin-type N-terminal cleavage/methylation domain-containing protein